MIITETPRLILRQFTWDDLDAIAEILADPIGMKYIGNGEPHTKEEVKEWLGKAISDSTYDWSEQTLNVVPQFLRARERNAHMSLWATIHRASGAFIGRCGLCPRRYYGDLHEFEVEVGYHLARAYWGRGLATEAARAVRDYALDRLGFDRLISIIAVGNTASERVATKNGMHLDRDTTMRGMPVHIYAMSREDRPTE